MPTPLISLSCPSPRSMARGPGVPAVEAFSYETMRLNCRPVSASTAPPTIAERTAPATGRESPEPLRRTGGAGVREAWETGEGTGEGRPRSPIHAAPMSQRLQLLAVYTGEGRDDTRRPGCNALQCYGAALTLTRRLCLIRVQRHCHCHQLMSSGLPHTQRPCHLAPARVPSRAAPTSRATCRDTCASPGRQRADPRRQRSRWQTDRQGAQCDARQGHRHRVCQSTASEMLGMIQSYHLHPQALLTPPHARRRTRPASAALASPPAPATPTARKRAPRPPPRAPPPAAPHAARPTAASEARARGSSAGSGSGVQVQGTPKRARAGSGGVAGAGKSAGGRGKREGEGAGVEEVRGAERRSVEDGWDGGRVRVGDDSVVGVGVEMEEREGEGRAAGTREVAGSVDGVGAAHTTWVAGVSLDASRASLAHELAMARDQGAGAGMVAEKGKETEGLAVGTGEGAGEGTEEVGGVGDGEEVGDRDGQGYAMEEAVDGEGEGGHRINYAMEEAVDGDGEGSYEGETFEEEVPEVRC